MRYGLSLDWERCPDGVQIVEVPTRIIGGTGGMFGGGETVSEPAFCYRSEERYNVRHELNDLSRPLVLRFVNARTEQDLEDLLSEIGLPDSYLPYLYSDPRGGPPALSTLPVGVQLPVDTVIVRHVISWQKILKIILKATQDNVSTGTDMLNREIEYTDALRLTPRIEKRRGEPTPALTLKPTNLYGFMLMEMALMLVGGGLLLICDHCGAMIVTGSGTAKRSHSKYCSDRCRVAAMRARKRAAAV